MNTRKIYIIGIAFFALLAITLLISRGGKNTDVETVPVVTMVPVVVATQPLAYGQVIAKDQLEVLEQPEANVPEGSFQTIDDIFVNEEKPFALQPLERDVILTRDLVSGFSASAIASTRIDPGMRAISIRVNEVLGVAGLIVPGDRVDVLLTRSLDHGGAATNGAAVAETLAEDLRVLAIDQTTNQSGAPKIGKTITVQAAPEVAQRIALGASVGDLSLTLRGTMAGERLTGGDALNPVFAKDLANMPAPKKKERPKRATRRKAPSGPSVTVVRSGSEQRERIQRE